MPEAFLQGLESILHAVSQALLYPVIIALLALVGYALFSIGSLLVEYFGERRYFNVVIPQFLRAIKETPVENIPQTIYKSGLLQEQQRTLLVVFENRDLDEESLWALAKKMLLLEKERKQRVVARNDTMAKIAPMIGLMGTLIPLGPGIVAFGQGDGTVMASSMLIAFDTTVAGLVVAAVVFVIARIRRRWYASYNTSLEAGMTTLLERIEKIQTQSPQAQQVQTQATQTQSPQTQQVQTQATQGQPTQGQATQGQQVQTQLPQVQQVQANKSNVDTLRG